MSHDMHKCAQISIYLKLKPTIQPNRNHTLALVKSTGRIYGCGLGGSGQLGTGFLTNHKIPTPVLGNWCPLYTPAQGVPVDHNLFLVKKIFAGGDQSFATFSMPYVSIMFMFVSSFIRTLHAYMHITYTRMHAHTHTHTHTHTRTHTPQTITLSYSPTGPHICS